MSYREDIAKSNRDDESKQSQQASQYSLEQFKGLPKFIEKLNQNIKDIDDRISSNVAKENSKGNKNNVVKNNMVQECADIKNLVKQSVDGLSDILNMKTNKSTAANVHSSVKNNNADYFEIIEEEDPGKFNEYYKKKDYPVNRNKVNNNSRDSHNVSTENPQVRKEDMKNLKMKINFDNSANTSGNNDNINSSSNTNPLPVKSSFTNNNTSKSKIKSSISHKSSLNSNSNNNRSGNTSANIDNNDISINCQANEKLNKNIRLLKEKITNKITNPNFIKNQSQSVNSSANLEDNFIAGFVNKKDDENKLPSDRLKINTDNVISHVSKIIKEEKNIEKSYANKSNKSVNKRYENEEKKETKSKSKSPVPSKSSAYQLKPKVRKDLSENPNNSSNNIIKKQASNNNYFTENKGQNLAVLIKNSSKKVISAFTTNKNTEMKNSTSRNIIQNKLTKQVNPSLDSFNNSINNTANSVNNPNSGKIYTKQPRTAVNKNIKNFLNTPSEYQINNFLQMSILFNEINQPSIKDYDNKLISEDMTKLISSLIEFNKISKSEENSIITNKSIELNFNPQNITNVDKIIKIQRFWRNFKMVQHFQIRLDKDSYKKRNEKINSAVKMSILDKFTSDDNFRQILSHLTTACNLFNEFINFNQDMNRMLQDYISLSKDSVIKKEKHKIYKKFLDKNLSQKEVKSNTTNTTNTANATNTKQIYLKSEIPQSNRSMVTPLSSYSKSPQKLNSSISNNDPFSQIQIPKFNLKNIIIATSASANLSSSNNGSFLDEKERELKVEKQKQIAKRIVGNTSFINNNNILSKSQPLNLSTDRDNKVVSITLEQEYSENNMNLKDKDNIS